MIVCYTQSVPAGDIFNCMHDVSFLLKMKLMSEKYSRDAENLRKQNTKQMDEQEKRLKNMAEANLEKLRSDNAQQLSGLRDDFTRKEKQLMQNNARTQDEIRRKQNEINQLRQQINSRPPPRKKKGGF